MVCSILLPVLASETPTADWWKSFNSQSGSTKRVVLKCNTESKTEYTTSERAMKTELKSDVRLFVVFCLTYFIVWQVVTGSCSKSLIKRSEWTMKYPRSILSILMLTLTCCQGDSKRDAVNANDVVKPVKGNVLFFLPVVPKSTIIAVTPILHCTKWYTKSLQFN